MWESCLVITCCSTFCTLIVFTCTGCASPSRPASEQTALRDLTPLHPCAALTCEASWDSMPGLSSAPPGAVTALLLLPLPEAFTGQMVWCQRGLPTLSDPVTRCLGACHPSLSRILSSQLYLQGNTFFHAFTISNIIFS